MFHLAIMGVMAWLAACAGGNGGVKLPKALPECLFAAVIAVAAYMQTQAAVVAPFAFVWAYLAMQAGHGNFYRMGGVDINGGVWPDEPELIEKALRPLYEFFGGDIHKPAYSWVMMGAKGLLIGIPIVPYGLPLAVLWPAAYWFSMRVIKKESAPAEWITGACAGLMAAVSMVASYG